MSNFLDQFNDNVRQHNRRLPQRLLKVAIVIGMVILVAPLTSVVGTRLDRRRRWSSPWPDWWPRSSSGGWFVSAAATGHHFYARRPLPRR